MQRPLWASTGVKDKSYDSTRYVVDLVAPNCVNTMPEGTLNEVRSHGVVQERTLSQDFQSCRAVFSQLAIEGIDIQKVVRHLEDDGVVKFEKAWIELLANVEAVQ
jgi:transaldolase